MRFILLFALAFLTAGLANAVTARAELSYTFKTSDRFQYLLVTGQFSPDEPLDRFQDAVNRYRPDFITFNSNGGSVTSAMGIGRRIRAMGLNTVQIRQLECASACSLAFLGGVQRTAAPGSIGVHRSSFDVSNTIGRDEAVATVQEVTAEIISYLGEMGVSPELLSFAYRYDQNDIRYLSASEMQGLRVITTEPELNMDAPAPPPPIALEKKQFGKADAYELVRGLIEEHGSGSATALDTVSKIYAPALSYYGQERSLQEVLSDKRSYFDRWPERTYRIRPKSLEITCNDIKCTVSGIYDWSVRSAPRNRQAQGAAKFFYAIKVGNTPQITAEAGFVLK